MMLALGMMMAQTLQVVNERVSLGIPPTTYVCRNDSPLPNGKVGYGCDPMVVMAADVTERTVLGYEHCHGDEKSALVWACEPITQTSHTYHCTDTRRILLSSESGQHFCLLLPEARTEGK